MDKVEELDKYRHENATDIDLNNSFTLFSIMFYCPENYIIELYVFFDNLLENENLKTIIATTVNSLQSPYVTNSDVIRKNVKSFYQS